MNFEEEKIYIKQIQSVLNTSEEDALTVNHIADAVGLPHGRTGEVVRNLLKKMIFAPYYVPVVSSHSGYWIATSELDIQQSIENLGYRIKGIEKRISGLKNAWEKKDEPPKEKQLELFSMFGDLFAKVF